MSAPAESGSREGRDGLVRLAPYVHEPRGGLVRLGVAATLNAAAGVASWLVVRDAIDSGIATGDERRLGLDVALYVLLTLLAWALSTYVVREIGRIGQAVLLELRHDLFRHLTGLSLRYFSEQRAGWIIARLTSDVDTLGEVLSPQLGALVWGVLTVVGCVIGIAVLDLRLVLVVLLLVLPGAVLARWYHRRSRVAFVEVRTRVAALTAQVAESVAGMAIVQAYRREERFAQTFGELNRGNRDANVAAQKLSSVFFPSVELLGALGTALLLVVGATLIDAGQTSPGTVIACVGLLWRLFDPLGELSELYGALQSADAAMRKITTVLDADADVVDAPHARALGRIDGALVLDDVHFRYGERPTLDGIDADVPAGGCLALVGASGGGKSTIAKLVARFYDPADGAVRVDGVDLRDATLASLRRQLGVVLQDPFLFAGTIRSNVRFGRPDATDAEVEAAAAAVGVDRVAARFAEGLDHPVREGGAGLSAGERQLVSIARALLADPRILILDEATSNIDRPTERLVERALDRLLDGRTSIIIAHRLATVRRADEVLVIEHGRVVERGAPDVLAEGDGPFRQLLERHGSVGVVDEEVEAAD